MLISARTRSGVKRFRRAGFSFTSTPQNIEVDEEQLKRLDAEPMIEISEAVNADEEDDSDDSDNVEIWAEADLLRMTNAELFDMAEEFGIDVDPGSTKKQIVAELIKDQRG